MGPREQYLIHSFLPLVASILSTHKQTALSSLFVVLPTDKDIIAENQPEETLLTIKDLTEHFLKTAPYLGYCKVPVYPKPEENCYTTKYEIFTAPKFPKILTVQSMK